MTCCAPIAGFIAAALVATPFWNVKQVPPGAAHAALIAAGYIDVPLLRKPQCLNHYVRVQRGTASLTLIVDTGAGVSALDAAAAKRLNVTTINTGREHYGFGGPNKVLDAQVRGLRIGAVELIQTYTAVSDLSKLIEANVNSDGVRFDGILGSSTLIYYSAVLDMAGERLYLLDPAKQESKLQGHWVVDTIRAGREGRPPLPPRPIHVKIEGTTLTYLQDGKPVATYSLVLDLKATPKRMDWVVDNGGALPGSYEFNGEVLRIAMPLFPGSDFTARPTKFTVTGDDKFAVLELYKFPPALPPLPPPMAMPMPPPR